MKMAIKFKVKIINKFLPIKKGKIENNKLKKRFN